MNSPKVFQRNLLHAFLITLGLICGAIGCSKSATSDTPEAKQAFLGDASKMPASAKRDVAQMAQQNAQAAQQAQQKAQQQVPPKK